MKAKNLDEAVDKLIDRLDGAGLVSDREALDSVVHADRDRAPVTALGTRAIFVHFRSEAVEELAVAVAGATKKFSFAPPQAPDADLLILIVAPRKAAKQYLKALAALSELLGDPAYAEALATAGSTEEFLGLLAGKDLVLRPELLVRDLMSRTVRTVAPETLLSETLRVMARHSRRAVPVVSDNGEVLGLVNESVVLQHFLPQILSGAARGEEAAQIEDIEVRHVMERSVMCLSEDQLISDVLGTMLTERVAQFPVVKEGKLVGFLSRTDLIHKLLDQSI
jgi:CBS domain-containing protein